VHALTQRGLARAADSLTNDDTNAHAATMTDILTITLNPAVDASTSTERLVPAHKLRCGPAQRLPGGGGINVARVVQRLGGASCRALYLAGGVMGRQLNELLATEQVPTHCLEIRGDTRENLSVRETTSGHEYRFVLPGPQVDAQEWQACLDAVAALDHAPRLVVLSGSLPPGLPPDSYALLTRLAQSRGSRVVVDSSGGPLAAALRHGVWLVKPSLRELSDYCGRLLPDEAAWHAAARGLVERGQARIVALSLGHEGALLVTAEGAWRAPAMAVPVQGTTGAGDSFLAGMLWAIARDMELLDAFRHAIAAGSASLLTPGTQLCRRDDVLRLVGDVVLRRL